MARARIAPSILAADFGRLADEIAAVEGGGAELIHLDVMDGHFVPNLTIGPDLVRAVRRATELPLDVHLMVAEPDRHLDAFRAAGADWISVHVEAATHLERTLAEIRGLGARAGVVLNPATPLGTLDEVLGAMDYVLVMSVNPGFGGQSFLPRSLDKIRRLKMAIERAAVAVAIEVDGGIGEDNARAVVEAGADILVAGSAIFGKPAGRDPRAAMVRVRPPGAATRRLQGLANGLPVD